MKEQTLTYNLVHALGWDKIEHINADMLKGYTEIGSYAFSDCDGLTSIEIPNSINCIGEGAFSRLRSLTSSTIPDSVTDIEESAFFGCRSLTSIVIPDSITSIGKYAFLGCTGLTSIMIPNSVTSIGEKAFLNCIRLTSATIGNNVTRIGNKAFSNCSELTSVTIGNSVACIGTAAFLNCRKLASITIPNSVISIGGSAFEVCNGLISVTIDDIKYKKHRVIKGRCKAYKAFNSDMTCRDFKYKEGNTYGMDGDAKLCECGFHACLNLADVFNYYYGEFGKDIHIHEVELEGVSKERNDDSKVVGNKITIGKRII